MSPVTSRHAPPDDLDDGLGGVPPLTRDHVGRWTWTCLTCGTRHRSVSHHVALAAWRGHWREAHYVPPPRKDRYGIR